MTELEQYYVPVRFETGGKTYTFSTNGLELRNKDKVVVETKRGLELGEIAGEPLKESGLSKDFEIKNVIRKATPQDEKDFLSNKEDAKKARHVAQAEADKLDLKMNFISAEYTLDRSKITLTYLSENRVDFRDLLKVLGAKMHCRIDLRQVGARDKAKMVGGIGVCGRELCCKGFLNEFERISINMAKNQLLALNIAKLSGHCGALMCCLRFEEDAYKELRKGLPKINAHVDYEGESYRLTAMNVLDRSCKLENRNHALFLSLDELLQKGSFKRPQEDKKESDDSNHGESLA